MKRVRGFTFRMPGALNGVSDSSVARHMPDHESAERHRGFEGLKRSCQAPVSSHGPSGRIDRPPEQVPNSKKAAQGGFMLWFEEALMQPVFTLFTADATERRLL